MLRQVSAMEERLTEKCGVKTERKGEHGGHKAGIAFVFGDGRDNINIPKIEQK